MYRYGFNGKENDNEVKGESNQQDYGMRIYDGRLGKFFSVDPLTNGYPWYTPYQFAGNKPIQFIDLDGLEEFPSQYLNSPSGSPLLTNKNPFKKIGTTDLPIRKPHIAFPEIVDWDELKKFKEDHGLLFVGKALGNVLLFRGMGGGGIGTRSLGAYFGNRSILAGIDAFSQLSINNFDVNKVDWIDVATTYLPGIKGKWSDVLTTVYKNVISASFDYTTDKKTGGLNTVFGDKPLTDAGVEAFVGTMVEGIYGQINKSLINHLETQGLNKSSIETTMLEVTNKQRELITSMIKVGLQDLTRPSNPTKNE